MMITPRSKADLVHAYFRSGWAFLVPYLLVYLLYAGLKWPVNPGGSGTDADGGWSMVPALLHVYLLMHAMHLALGAIGLRNALRAAAVLRPPSSVLWSLAPWLGLALIFWIPGVYLEFPADPWQHYARTNEWSWHTLVTDHPYWEKSSYFLAYSLIGRISPALLQLKFFDLYYTGCCLLLCWQYHRLARAIGLSERTSLLFVLLNVLTFGNNLFGFYRYYGMSSTVFAQLGAVALTRIAIELARGRKEENLTEKGPTGYSSRLPFPRALLRQGTSAAALVALTAFNHVQGVGIAAIGITAVIVWRLVAWRKSMVITLGLAAIALSVATVLWFPRHPLIDSAYRPNGWMSPWYGLPLFQPHAPGFQLGWVIFGAIGALNLLAALVLLWRNRIEGWLAVMPVLLLSLPVVAIPLASVLAGSTEAGENGYLMAYPRMLFAMPMGMAICALLSQASDFLPLRTWRPALSWVPNRSAFGVVTGGLVIFAVMPASSPVYNRLYNALMVAPADLSLRSTLEAVDSLKTARPDPKLGEKLITAYGPGYAAKASGLNHLILATKWNPHPQPTTTIWVESYLKYVGKTPSDWVLLAPDQHGLHTPWSASGMMSKHWLPNRVALESTGRAEIIRTAAASGATAQAYGAHIFYEHRSDQGPPVRPAQ